MSALRSTKVLEANFVFLAQRRERSSLIIRVWCDQYGSSVWDPRCVGLNEE